MNYTVGRALEHLESSGNIYIIYTCIYIINGPTVLCMMGGGGGGGGMRCIRP